MFKDTFYAFSDPIRQKILELLKDKTMNAGEIAKNFNLTKPTISYHLNILKKADLIREKKVKNFIYFELNTSIFEDLILWFSKFKGDEKNV